MKDRRTLADAKILMERHQMSGLNIEAFCTEELINPATFYYCVNTTGEWEEWILFILNAIEKTAIRTIEKIWIFR